MRASRHGAGAGLAAVAFAGLVAACGSTGDTADLLVEGARACSAVCTRHPELRSFAYRAGGGAPLLFLGTVEADCRCAAGPLGTPGAGDGARDGRS